jgi:hypothetical protein
LGEVRVHYPSLIEIDAYEDAIVSWVYGYFFWTDVLVVTSQGEQVVSSVAII